MKKFKTQRGVQRAQTILDKIARAAWEPFHNNEEGYSSNEMPSGPLFNKEGKPFDQFARGLDYAMGVVRGQLIGAGIRLHQTRTDKGHAPSGVDIASPNGGWVNFEYDKIVEIIVSDQIQSVADAVVKATAHLSLLANSVPSSHRRYLFRGQSNIEHPLVPRLGRRIQRETDAGHGPHYDPLKITSIEQDGLQRFKASWPSEEVDNLDLNLQASLKEDDAGWWTLMQHYDQGDGTRLLDVTSSLLVALLFACVRWVDGSIDNDIDGVVYLFHEGQNAIAEDYLLRRAPSASRFFDASQSDEDIPRMVFNPPHNERSKAQTGSFIWWPRFWEPYPNSSMAYLRIPGERKADIARELLAFGVGPKEAVRGSKGLENEKALRATLGLPAWDPFALYESM